ncbi:MAG: DNA gyrase inhibitor YacG [Gammaproteobacteria bacterium]
MYHSCPQCQKPCEYTKENPYRPFCSERCKIIDLGAWASESYRIPLSQQEGYGGGEVGSFNTDDEKNS